VAGWGLELILRWISEADSQSERIAGLDAAIEAFDHNDEDEHDREIKQGVPQELTHLLALIILENNDGADGDEEEEGGMDLGEETERIEVISKILLVLEMVHRCSYRYLSYSFDVNGAQLVPILIEIIDNCAAKIKTSDWDFHSVFFAVKIMGYFCNIENGNLGLCSHRSFLDSMHSILSVEVDGSEDEVLDIHCDILNEVLSKYPKPKKLLRLNPMLLETTLTNIALNPKANHQAQEAVANFFASMLITSRTFRKDLLEENSGEVAFSVGNKLLEFLTLVMMDERLNDSTLGCARFSAAKAAYLVCIPEGNAEKLISYHLPVKEDYCGFDINNYLQHIAENSQTKLKFGSFVYAMVQMIQNGSESYTAASGLCHLMGNNEVLREDLSSNPVLLDTLGKMVLINPNIEEATEAISKILPYTNHAVFRKIILLMSLPVFAKNGHMNKASVMPDARTVNSESDAGDDGNTPPIVSNSFNRKSQHMSLIRTVTSMLLDRIRSHPSVRSSMASDECIIMILSKTSINIESDDQSDDAINIRAMASEALHELSVSTESRKVMLEDPNIEEALVKALNEAHFNESSELWSFHSASATATCAIGNLVINESSNAKFCALLEVKKNEEAHKKSFIWSIYKIMPWIRKTSKEKRRR